MNMLCLKPCAAHTGFPCKDHSAKLQFVIFRQENHVSQSFYWFMLRDKGHCLQVLRFERGNANGKQSNIIIAVQFVQSFHRRTVPMENNNTKQWNLFD